MNREKDSFDENYEYKNDINELYLEEKEKDKIINTKEFSHFLNNRNFYENKEQKNTKHNTENDVEDETKIKKLNYLKNLAFNDSLENSDRSLHNNNDADDNSEYSSNNPNKSLKKQQQVFDDEQQLKIGGKIFQMNTQMDKIAKEILNKCKIYRNKKL